jgi:hypothetical protein
MVETKPKRSKEKFLKFIEEDRINTIQGTQKSPNDNVFLLGLETETRHRSNALAFKNRIAFDLANQISFTGFLIEKETKILGIQ